MWHVSSRSGVATLLTAVHLLLTYLITYCLVWHRIPNNEVIVDIRLCPRSSPDT